MDFGKVLGRAWQITWRWKILWILGFLASLGQGSGGGTGQFNYTLSGDEFDFDRWGWRLGTQLEEFWITFAGIVLLIICLLFILAIVFWVISVISRGGLIAGVQQIEEEGSTSFGQAWRGGARKFWTLFGLAVLAALPLIVMVIIGLVVLGLGIAGGVGLLDVSEAAGVSTIIFFAVTCGGFLCCGFFLVVIVLEQIRIYGERAAILEDLGWIDAFSRGWQVLKENLGATILLWLIFFAIGIVIFGISFVILFALAAPLLGLFAVDEPGLWLFGPFCFGGLLSALIFALIRTLVTVFTSATWTLAYREFAAMRQQVEEFVE